MIIGLPFRSTVLDPGQFFFFFFFEGDKFYSFYLSIMSWDYSIIFREKWPWPLTHLSVGVCDAISLPITSKKKGDSKVNYWRVFRQKGDSGIGYSQNNVYKHAGNLRETRHTFSSVRLMMTAPLPRESKLLFTWLGAGCSVHLSQIHGILLIRLWEIYCDKWRTWGCWMVYLLFFH